MSGLDPYRTGAACSDSTLLEVNPGDARFTPIGRHSLDSGSRSYVYGASDPMLRPMIPANQPGRAR